MVCDKHVIAKDLLEKKKKTNNMRLAREKKNKINEKFPFKYKSVILLQYVPQEKIMRQRGNLKVLAATREFHLSYF